MWLTMYLKQVLFRVGPVHVVPRDVTLRSFCVNALNEKRGNRFCTVGTGAAWPCHRHDSKCLGSSHAFRSPLTLPRKTQSTFLLLFLLFQTPFFESAAVYSSVSTGPSSENTYIDHPPLWLPQRRIVCLSCVFFLPCLPCTWFR